MAGVVGELLDEILVALAQRVLGQVGDGEFQTRISRLMAVEEQKVGNRVHGADVLNSLPEDPVSPDTCVNPKIRKVPEGGAPRVHECHSRGDSVFLGGVRGFEACAH